MWFSTVCFQLKEFANFDFDVWRKKYMRWMNHKKSRVMDFFRRIDKDQDGKITRLEFIDGILESSRFTGHVATGLSPVCVVLMAVKTLTESLSPL